MFSAEVHFIALLFYVKYFIISLYFHCFLIAARGSHRNVRSRSSQWNVCSRGRINLEFLYFIVCRRRCLLKVILMDAAWPIDEIDKRWKSIPIAINRCQLIDWYRKSMTNRWGGKLFLSIFIDFLSIIFNCHRLSSVVFQLDRFRLITTTQQCVTINWFTFA